MSIIEIIRTKPGKEFKTIVSRSAVSNIFYEGGSNIVIQLLGGEKIHLGTANDDNAKQAYDDIKVALQQPADRSSTVTISLI